MEHDANVTLTLEAHAGLANTLMDDLSPHETAMLIALAEEDDAAFDPAEVARLMQHIQVSGMPAGGSADEPTESELVALVAAHEGVEADPVALDAALNCAGAGISPAQAGPEPPHADTHSETDDSEETHEDSHEDAEDIIVEPIEPEPVVIGLDFNTWAAQQPLVPQEIRDNHAAFIRDRLGLNEDEDEHEHEEGTEEGGAGQQHDAASEPSGDDRADDAVVDAAPAPATWRPLNVVNHCLVM